MRIEGFKVYNPSKEGQVLIEFGPAELTPAEFIELITSMLSKIPAIAQDILRQMQSTKE
jgi:hypothetical protein